jgi:hypothetical protein
MTARMPRMATGEAENGPPGTAKETVYSVSIDGVL